MRTNRHCTGGGSAIVLIPLLKCLTRLIWYGFTTDLKRCLVKDLVRAQAGKQEYYESLKEVAYECLA